MSFPSQLVSPNGVTVAVGSAREHLTLHSQGYKTPEQVTAAAELAAAHADLNSARESGATALSGLKDELGDGGDPGATTSAGNQTGLGSAGESETSPLSALESQLGGDPVPPKPPTGRAARTK